MIEERCNHMIANIPLNSDYNNELETQHHNQQYELKEYKGNNFNNMTNIMSPISALNDTYSPTRTTLDRTTMLNGTTMSNTTTGQYLKASAIKQVPEIKSVDNSEMDAVPK